MQRTKNSIINLITAFIGQIFGVAISFLTRMIFVKYLSSEYLGINGLFTNILTMISLAELGVGSAMVYSLYKPIAEENTEKIKSLLLMNENKKITVTLLAKKMNVSKATMSRMINTFYEQGLTLDKGKCQLSKKGQEYIEKIQEKIKNLTYWLQETSHLNEEEARQEAIKLYTTLNDETIERICSRIHFNKVFARNRPSAWRLQF